MNIAKLSLREIRHRKFNFGLAVLAIALATGSFIGSLTFLDLHDRQTEGIMREKREEARQIMADLREEMRKAGLDLSQNLLILPKEQNLRDYYAEDYAQEHMPEEYVDRLAESGMVLARHFLPSLRRRLEWPEKNRAIILVGSRGQVPNIYMDARQPLVQSVPEQTIVLGSELARSLELEVGDSTTFMGRELTVHRVHDPRGTADDITAWIFLREAQELLGMEGRINAIMALECMCPIEGMTPKQAIQEILPETQVIEMGTHMQAREDSRQRAAQETAAALDRVEQERAQERVAIQRLMAIVVPVVMVACVVWVGLLAYQNVKTRRFEVGLLRALGVDATRIVLLVLFKALATGIAGGLAGALLGFGGAGGIVSGMQEEGAPWIGAHILWNPPLLILGLLAAVALTVLSTWIPALLAARRDPAIVLRGE